MKRRLRELKERMRALWGENKPILGGIGDAPCAECENGTFVGRRADSVAVWRGIPFAQPPVGPLRWKRPLPPEPRDGLFEAYYNGRTPIQTEWETEVASFYAHGEDCLYLNVWPGAANKSTQKTVMVSIHGGSYGWGGTADPLYDGRNFVASHPDVILVTIGYRTGLMGFTDFSSVPGGEDYADAPNLGLLDQIEALRWIHRNAAAFGGDPENVTVFGESAGGGSVSLLPLIPEAKGLFRRVIAESGSVALTFSKDECALFTKLLLKESRCKTMAELAALSEAELMKVNEKINAYNNFPQRDGRLLPLDLYEPYLNGTTAGVDMILGTNRDETNYWIGELGGIIPYALCGPVKFENDLRLLTKEDRTRVRDFLKAETHGRKLRLWRLGEFYNEMMFRLPAVRQAEGHARNGGSVRMYYWTEPSAIRFRGACHAVELAYVFGNLQETIYTGVPGDPALAHRVQDMWANFARTGDPGIPDLPWPEYDPAGRQTMVLGRDCAVEPDVLKVQREILSPLLSYWINPSYVDLSYNVPFVRKVVLAEAVIFLALLALILKLCGVI